MKGNKGVRLDYDDIAMVCVCRWKKLKIITKTHQVYVLKFPAIDTLDLAVADFNTYGAKVMIMFGGRGV